MTALPDSQSERERLEHQLEFLQAQIEEIRKRLEAIAAAETAGKTS
jgi:phage shock protein A